VGDREQGTARVRVGRLKKVRDNCLFLLFSKHYWAWHVARIGDKFLQILVKKLEGIVPLDRMIELKSNLKERNNVMCQLGATR